MNNVVRRLRPRLVAFAVAATIVASGCTTLTEVSDRSGENPADFGFVRYDGGGPTVSRDGRFAVFLGATNATDPPGATSGYSQAYRRDNQTGDVVRVSSFADGSPAQAFGVAISGDGRYVAFVTWAALVPEDTNAPAGEPNIWGSDVYVRDMVTGVVTRESLAPNGKQFSSGGGYGIIDPTVSISDDGRFIAFANRFDSHDAVLYVRRRVAHTTKLVLHANEQLGGLSGDGLHLAIVPNNGCIRFPLCQPKDVARILDWQTGASFALGTCSPSFPVALSFDGRFAALSQYDDSDPTCNSGVWRWDRNGGPPIQVSHDAANAPRQGDRPSISFDGNRVAFHSLDAIVPEDTNAFPDVYVADLNAGIVALASADAFGTAGNGESNLAWISGGGQYVTFTSSATNLIPSPGDDHPDVIMVPAIRPRISLIQADSGTRGRTIDVTALGSGIAQNSAAAIDGTGVAVTNVRVVTSTTVILTVTIASDASTGPRNLTIVNPGAYGSAAAWCFGCFTVT